MKKEYFNQEAYDYVASQINKTKINSVFKPIVIDIILRRRHEYQLDDKCFHRDVESFIRNVKDIYFEDWPVEDRYGEFSHKKKCIRINRNAFKENMSDEKFAEKLFAVLSHECGHAMNFNIIGTDRTFGEVDSAVDDAGTVEVFTEKESDRIIFNRNPEDAFEYHNKTTGYSITTKFVNAIAVAFGIKEKELLSAAIKGKRELYKALNTNLKDRNFVKKSFEDIKLNINLAHIEFMKDKVDEVKFENIENSLEFIYRALEETLAYRVEKLEWDNLEELQKKLEDIKLSQNAISNTIPRVKRGVYEKVVEFVRSEKTKVYAKVMCMEEIIRSKGEKSRDLISFVQQSESVDEILEFMKQNGVEIDSENLALMPEFELSQQKKDEWVKEFCLDGEEWDNTERYNDIIAKREEIEKVEEKKLTFIDKIKRNMERRPEVIIKNYIKMFKGLQKVSKKLWKALPKKEKSLLLDERKTRKNRGGQETMGCGKLWSKARRHPTSSS